jgi:hypothetical protein
MKEVVVSKKPQRAKSNSAISKLIFCLWQKTIRNLVFQNNLPRHPQDAFDGTVVA